MKEPSKRNLFDIKYLHKHLKDVDFIKKYMEEGNLTLPKALYRELGYYKAEQGQTVIKYGDIGDTFYILLKGAVDVCELLVYKLTTLKFLIWDFYSLKTY